MESLGTTLVAVLAALAIGYANGGVPVGPCNAAAPDFQQCVRTTIQHLIPQLAAGLPNIGAEPTDPMQNLPPVKHSSHSFNMQMDDVVLRGLSTVIVGDVNVDLASNTININAAFPGQILATGIHTTEGEIMGIPLKGSGPFKVSMVNSGLQLSLSGTPAVGPDGQTYLQINSGATRMQTGSVSADIDGYFTHFTPLARAASAFANSIAGPAMEELRPTLENWLATIAVQRAQAIFSSVPYDSIFPGRTPAVAGLYRAFPVLSPLLHSLHK